MTDSTFSPNLRAHLRKKHNRSKRCKEEERSIEGNDTIILSLYISTSADDSLCSEHYRRVSIPDPQLQALGGSSSILAILVSR